MLKMDTRHHPNSRQPRRRGFVHVLLLVMFMFGVVVYGVLESQTNLLSLQSAEPTQTRVALNQAREGLAEFASREENPAQRDFADTHPPYTYYNLYSAETVAEVEDDIATVTGSDYALELSFRYAANDRFVVWRPGQLPCPDTWGDDTDAKDVVFALWHDDNDFDGLADYDDSFCASDEIDLQDGVPAGSRAGRLPWREYFDNIAYSRGVGVGDLRDSNNDRLWYVVASAPVDVTRPLSPYRVARDDSGWLTLKFEDNSTPAGSRALGDITVGRIAAAVISPGRPGLDVDRRSEDEWFSLEGDTPVASRSGSAYERALPDKYLEGNLVTMSLTEGAVITVSVSRDPHADTYELLSADELLDAFAAWDEDRRMGGIAAALDSFEQRFGYLPTPATFDRENSEFINRRLGRAGVPSQFLNGSRVGGLFAIPESLQGATALYHTEPVRVMGTGVDFIDTTLFFGVEGDQAVLGVGQAPKVRLSPYAVSRALIETSQLGFAYAPPFGELHLDSTTNPAFLSVDVFNIVVPPHTPLVAGGPYLAFSRANYEQWSFVNPRVGTGPIQGSGGASAFFADLAPANSGELGRRGYAFKFNEGSLLYADISLTLALEDAYLPLVGVAGLTIDRSQEFRAIASPATRLYAGLAVDANTADVFALPPERTPLVPGNQGLLPTAVLPGQVPVVAEAQMESNNRGFMEPYYHPYTSAETDVGSTDDMLIVGAGGAIGQFPSRVTMRGFDILVNIGQNRLRGRNSFAGIARNTELRATMPRVRAYAFDAQQIPSELTVLGRIEIPAGSRFLYPAGYMFAIGKSSFIHTSGIPRPDGEPNTGILRSPLQFDYSDYANGAVVHLGKGAVLHDVRVPRNSVLPDGSVHMTVATTMTLTLTSGGLMRYTQLLHHTPNFGDSLLPRTQQQAAFRIRMQLEHQVLPDLVRGGVTVGSLAEQLEQDRDWHLVYPYHGLVAPKSQRMHPQLGVDFSDGSITVATAMTSRIHNWLGRAQMQYQAAGRRGAAVAVDSDVYPLLESSLTMTAVLRRSDLLTVGASYARTDFIGAGAELAAIIGSNSALASVSIDGQAPLTVDMDRGMKMAVNPADLWFGVVSTTISHSETSTITINVISTLTTAMTTSMVLPANVVGPFPFTNTLSIPIIATITNVISSVTVTLTTSVPAMMTVSVAFTTGVDMTLMMTTSATTTMTVATPMQTIVATTLTLDSAFMRVRLLGNPHNKTPFVAPVDKLAGDDGIGMIDGSPPEMSSRFTEHALHFADSTIDGNDGLFVGNMDPPDDSLPLFLGFADADEIDFLDVISPLAATLDLYLRRQEGIGAFNYGMMQLDTDAAMHVVKGSETESQLLPAGTRVIFDTEVAVGEVMNAEVVTVTRVALPPGLAAGAIQVRGSTLSIGMLTLARVASKTVERLIPYARVGRGSGYYPIPNDVDVMLYGDGEAVLTGFPQTVTMYAESFNELLGRTVDMGTVQTLVLTNPRIILPAGSRIPRVWWQELPLVHINTNAGNPTRFPHMVVISTTGIRTTMASLASPPAGVATVAVSRDYYSGYHEVFSISPGTEIVADTIEAFEPMITSFSSTVRARLNVDVPVSATRTSITLTSMQVPENSGFGLVLETAGEPNLKMVAAEGGVLVQDYDFAGVINTIALGRVLPGQVIRSRSGGPGGLSRVELDFGSLDGDIEYEEFAARDLIFSQNNPVFYAIADECRDLHAQNDREIVDKSDCAAGDGEGLLVEVLPDEEIILPEETVAPPHLVIASRDPHGTRVALEVSYGSTMLSVDMLQLREDGQLRPLSASIPSSASLPGYHVEEIRGDSPDPLAILPGTEVTIATRSPEGFEFYLADDSLRGAQMSVTVFHDRGHSALGDSRQQIVMIAGGFTKGYEHLPAHRLVVASGDDLTLGIDSVIANGGLPEPTRAGPGSTHNSNDISGYQTLPGTDLAGAVFTVSADLPLKRRGFDNSYPIVNLIGRGSTVTVASPGIETSSEGRIVDLLAVSAIELGPPGYAWQGVLNGPGVVLQTATNTEVALRSYITQVSLNAQVLATVAPGALVQTVTVGGTTQIFEPAPGALLAHYMPMGIFARSGSALYSTAPGARARLVKALGYGQEVHEHRLLLR